MLGSASTSGCSDGSTFAPDEIAARRELERALNATRLRSRRAAAEGARSVRGIDISARMLDRARADTMAPEIVYVFHIAERFALQFGCDAYFPLLVGSSNSVQSGYQDDERAIPMINGFIGFRIYRINFSFESEVDQVFNDPVADGQLFG